MKQTVYVPFITGPSRAASFADQPELGGQGPSEVHIVLVDNGRLQMRKSDEFREALYCIKCGACLGACPVFTSVAGQTYGHIYQGGIGAVLTAFQNGVDQAADPASLCMGCMACKKVCPAHIDIPGMILRLRAKLVKEKGLSWKGKVAYRNILQNPGRLGMAMKVGSYLQRPFTNSDPMIERLPYPLDSLTRNVSLPALSRRPLADRLSSRSSPRGQARPKVAFYAGCIANYAYPDLGEDVMKVMQQYGVEAYFPPGQACCGAPSSFSGDVETP
jgi:L-lactate utilization protein LutB